MLIFQKDKNAVIVYCRTREQTEDLAHMLSKRGLVSLAYHGGMICKKKYFSYLYFTVFYYKTLTLFFVISKCILFANIYFCNKLFLLRFKDSRARVCAREVVSRRMSMRVCDCIVWDGRGQSYRPRRRTLGHRTKCRSLLSS